ncbi:alpha/beta-hydrolase [Trichoderma barbatum]
MKCWQLLSLAAVVASSPVPSIQDYTRMLKARQSDTSFSASEQDLNSFELFSQYSGAAYCNSETAPGQPVTCSDNACPDVSATVVDSFVGPLTGIGGFVAVDSARQQIVLSFRGTKNLRNFITDILFGFTDCSLVDGCEVHDGFNLAWSEVETAATDALTQARAANPSFGIVATGHSLGGAVATLGASFLRTQGFPIDIFTFGSPRVGNDVFADFVTSQPGAQFRVTHVDDPVPRLPPIILKYRHVSPEFWLSTGEGSTIDYTVADIEVCTGNANVDCNAGTSGLDLTAHSNYFRKVSACAPSPLSFKRDDNSTNFGYDQETIDRINRWSQEDQAYAASIQA